jgi:hypothetical protein
MMTKKKEIDEHVTNREFKLLLQPQGLERRARVNELAGLFRAFCEREKVEFFHLDNASTGLRTVYFYDTPGEHFRRSKLILRVREQRSNVWVDDWCEVTLKCRADTIKQALVYDPSPNTLYKFRRRLKEEILRGDGVGSARYIYSNNSIQDSVPVDEVFERTFDAIKQYYPDLKRLELDDSLPVGFVGGEKNKVLEANLPLGNISFGNQVHAHCDLAIWMRSVGDPIIGELAFAYRVNDENRDDTKAHKRADDFFIDLQHAIPSWLATGSTKTALIYGKPE